MIDKNECKWQGMGVIIINGKYDTIIVNVLSVKNTVAYK